MPGKGDVIQYAEQEEHDKCQSEVDKVLDIPGEEEDVLRYIDLCEYVRVVDERAHALRGGLAEKREDQVAAEQIGGIVRRAAAKKLRKNQPHDQKRQQRRQHAPGHAQHRALVFLLEVAFDQFFKEELVGFEGLDHKNLLRCLCCRLFYFSSSFQRPMWYRVRLSCPHQKLIYPGRSIA